MSLEDSYSSSELSYLGSSIDFSFEEEGPWLEVRIDQADNPHLDHDDLKNEIPLLASPVLDVQELRSAPKFHCFDTFDSFSASPPGGPMIEFHHGQKIGIVQRVDMASLLQRQENALEEAQACANRAGDLAQSASFDRKASILAQEVAKGAQDNVRVLLNARSGVAGNFTLLSKLSPTQRVDSVVMNALNASTQAHLNNGQVAWTGARRQQHSLLTAANTTDDEELHQLLDDARDELNRVPTIANRILERKQDLGPTSSVVVAAEIVRQTTQAEQTSTTSWRDFFKVFVPAWCVLATGNGISVAMSGAGIIKVITGTSAAVLLGTGVATPAALLAGGVFLLGTGSFALYKFVKTPPKLP